MTRPTTLHAQLSRAIAQTPCACTVDESCEPHHLLDQLVESYGPAPDDGSADKLREQRDAALDRAHSLAVSLDGRDETIADLRRTIVALRSTAVRKGTPEPSVDDFAPDYYAHPVEPSQHEVWTVDEREGVVTWTSAPPWCDPLWTGDGPHAGASLPWRQLYGSFAPVYLNRAAAERAAGLGE